MYQKNYKSKNGKYFHSFASNCRICGLSLPLWLHLKTVVIWAFYKPKNTGSQGWLICRWQLPSSWGLCSQMPEPSCCRFVIHVSAVYITSGGSSGSLSSDKFHSNHTVMHILLEVTPHHQLSHCIQTPDEAVGNIFRQTSNQANFIYICIFEYA